jgi:hypothetical protein
MRSAIYKGREDEKVLTAEQLLAWMNPFPARDALKYQTAVNWKSEVAGLAVRQLFLGKHYLDILSQYASLWGPAFHLTTGFQRLILEKLLIQPIKTADTFSWSAKSCSQSISTWLRIFTGIDLVAVLPAADHADLMVCRFLGRRGNGVCLRRPIEFIQGVPKMTNRKKIRSRSKTPGR